MSNVPQQRLLQTAIPGPRSAELQKRKTAAVSAGVSTGLPVYVERAGGGILVDVDGNQLIDFGSGIAVTTVGNAAPRVVDRVTAQVQDFTHTCFMVTPYEEYLEVAEALNDLTPGDHEKRTALFNSGAEAVENAVKVARHFTGRNAVVAFDHAYHGRTNLTMALTAKNMPYKHRFGPFAGEVYRAPMSYPFRWPGGPADCAKESFDAFVAQVHAQVGEDNLAAVILEPIQGEGGFIVPAPGFVKQVADWCTDNGILFIADEVQTGFCRTGDWFASEHEDVVPDLITTAKGMAGGLPLAGVTGRADVMDSIHAGGLGGTYGGNPVACASALGAIETMKEEDLCGRAKQVEALFLPRLEALAEKHPQIGDIRGRGAMLAVELVNGAGDLTPNAALTAAVNKACHAQGLVTLTCGTYGNVFRFLPPARRRRRAALRGPRHLREGVRRLRLRPHRPEPVCRPAELRRTAYRLGLPAGRVTHLRGAPGRLVLRRRRLAVEPPSSVPPRPAAAPPLGAAAAHRALDDAGHPLRSKHDLLPREAQHEPPARDELVVALAVPRHGRALAVELEAVGLQHDAERVVGEVDPGVEVVVADAVLRVPVRPGRRPARWRAAPTRRGWRPWRWRAARPPAPWRGGGDRARRPPTPPPDAAVRRAGPSRRPTAPRRRAGRGSSR